MSTSFKRDIHLREMAEAIEGSPSQDRNALIRGLLEIAYEHFDEYGPGYSQFETARDFWLAVVDSASDFYKPSQVPSPDDDPSLTPA